MVSLLVVKVLLPKIFQKYKMNYIDTGAMYRAFTLFCMRKGIIINNKINESQLRLHA